MATTTKKMTENPVVQRIVDLIREQGKKEKDLTDYLGISPGTMSKWKYDGSFVYIKHIDRICEFLDTTPNYLFFGPEDEEERLTPVEKEVIRMYRGLDQGRKKCIRDTLKYFRETKQSDG
jgi:DNA-binding Xre family transcriptional regulator